MNHRQNKAFILLIAVLLAGLVLAACNGLPFSGKQDQPTPIPTVIKDSAVNAEGMIVPKETSALFFETGGKIDQILVTDGQQVSKGDVLMRLGNREPLDSALAEAKLAQLKAQQDLDDLKKDADVNKAQADQALSTAQSALTEVTKTLDDLDTQDFQDDLDDKEIAVQDAKDDLDDAQDDVDKYKDLDKDNATRKKADDALDDAQQAYDDAVYDHDALVNQLNAAKRAVDLAQANVDKAQRDADAWKDGPDPDKLALAQSSLDQANAQVAAAQRALDNMDLVAPYDGTVLDINHMTAGEEITAGRTAVNYADLSDLYVETKDLTELDVVNVSIGQKVTVTPDALPDLALQGEVVSIDGAYTEKSGDIQYTVRIHLTDSDPLLRWGMTVTVDFEK